MRNFGKGSRGGDSLEQQLLNVQALNLINLSLGNAIDTETPARLKRQIDTSKGGDWFTASLAKRDKAGAILPVVPSASYDVASPKSSTQIPVGMLNSAALTPTYKAPGMPDFDEMKRQSVAAAMKRVDQAVALQPLDRQRVKDAVVRSVRFGKLDPKDLNRIVGYAQGGSAKIARLAGAGAYGTNVDHHSLASLMLELDGKFNSDKGYWQNRSAVKNALVGRLNAAGMSSEETYRLALRALGRTNELARMDAFEGQERYNAAHRAELGSTNSNLVGNDSQAVRWSKGPDGLTPLEHAQAVIRAKAAHGANPLWKGSAAANFDLLSLLPAGLKGLFASGLLASEGFSHPDDVARKEAGTVTHSSGIDSWVKRLPGLRDIEQFSQAVQGATDLWPNDIKAPTSYNIDHWNTNSRGDQALKFLGGIYDWGSVAKDIYKGARGFLQIAEDNRRRYAFEPVSSSAGQPSPTRIDATKQHIDAANATLNDLQTKSRSGGLWQYVKGLGITTDLATGKGIGLLGTKVTNLKELAEQAQLIRDPRMEVFRYIFMKDGKIVGQKAVSSRLSGASGAFVPHNGESWETWLGNELRAHDADGFYLLHNHPSGDPSISPEDFDLTSIVPHEDKFLGHVIVNSNKYSYIDRNGIPNTNKSADFFKGDDPFLFPSIPHDLIGQTIKGPDDLARLSRFYKVQRGLVTMIGLGHKNEVKILSEIPEDQLLGLNGIKDARALAASHRLVHQSGSERLFAVVPEERLHELSVAELRSLRWALENKVIADVIGGDGSSLVKKLNVDKNPWAPGKNELGPRRRNRNWH